MRVEHREVRRKDVFDMLPEHNVNLSLALQVIATGREEMEVLLRTIEEQWGGAGAEAGKAEAADGVGSEAAACRLHIDVNMGCPFPLQVRHGRGAGLLQRPERVEEICQFISEHAEHDFSVKMRLGVEDADEWRAVMPLLNGVRLKHVAVHPRVAKQQYGGEPDVEAFEALLAECVHPVIYNGDVTTVEQIAELETRYSTSAGSALAGVMIGRGLLARPTLAREYAEGRTCSDAEVVEALCRLHDAVYENYAARIPGEAQQLQKLRTFWDYAELTLGRKAWKKIHKAGSMRNYLAAVAAIG